MNSQNQENKKKGSLKSAHGVLLALTTALAAEAFFKGIVDTNSYFTSIGRVSISFLTLYTIHRFSLDSLKSYKPRLRDLICIHIMLMLSLAIILFGKLISFGLATYGEKANFIQGVSASSFDFGIPFAVGALILQAVLGLHYGLIFTISLALIFGIYFPEQFLFVPYIIAASMVACLSLSRFRSRSAYVRAGLNITIISFPFALASLAVSNQLVTADIGVRLVGSLASGAICSMIAAGFTPILEYIGGYVTDMRLIEMATLDHPLLKDLSVTAPGTWNHSMVIGMMVESAADAVGANPIVARVGAYFHDIGKTKKPLYFVENQGGENRHDKLSTSMSALIIRSHVKDGIELAKQHKIPQVIEDMIPQHHGTSLIEYFYNKAKTEAEEAGQNPEEIDKSLYSYPGPKPQTKEAGILMLADGIEAAARTLKEPTPDRIQGLVQKMINKVFRSGELNECELTLKDLHEIAKSFTRVLTGIYHHRIAYVEPAEKVKETKPESEEAETKPPTAEKESSKKTKTEQETKEEKKPDQDDLKRLGMQ
ncbi:MAG: HDIG domain-containing protein [Bdellovibrionales bacterium]|nr:HDIG domain-containing protein [Bdellovibrionales bacterium]